MDLDLQLPKEWKWHTVADLAAPIGRAIVSGPFGSNIGSRFFVESGIPVIRGNNLTTDARKFIDDGFVFVTPEKATELGHVDAIRDDIVVTAAGSLGQVGIIPTNSRFSKYVISNKQIRVRFDRNVVEPLYAYYWLSSKPMVETIKQQNTGSSVPLINLSIVRRLPVPLAPIGEQRGIVGILVSLDAKIELNRRMNETLESMGRALFRSWFIDFDPVRAKAAGQEPKGLDPATAKLFPNRFTDTALGEVPAGWIAGTMKDCCATVGNGGTPKRDVADYWTPASIPWLTSGEVREPIIISTANLISDRGLRESSAKMWSPWTTVVALYGATAAETCIIAEPLCANQACCGLTPKPNRRFFNFIALSTSKQQLVQQARGSAQQNLSKQIVEDVSTIIPSG